MARGRTNQRHVDRPPGVDPWFSGTVVPGYSQADDLDPTGYSLRDPEAQQVLRDTEGGFGPLPDRYGEDVGPVAGGYLGEPGANSTKEGLGMSGALPSGSGPRWAGPQHAFSPAPLEYQTPGDRAGTVPAFAVPPSPEVRARRFGESDPGARL